MIDVIVIGAGHNGLVAAATLAGTGFKTLVLERTERPGGCARTSELAPGFHCPTLAHAASIESSLVRQLGLDRHGLQVLSPEALVCAPTLDGRALTLWRDAARAADGIRSFSTRDAELYPRFVGSFAQVATVLRAIGSAPPPSIDRTSVRDLLDLFRTGRAFRRLSTANARRLLRWMPMSVADMVGEWFESEPLRATLAAGGVLGSFLGPRSPGSAALLLMLGAGEGAAVPGWFAKGGPGAIGTALAAAACGRGVQFRTSVEVAAITVADGSATGVTLATGESIAARAVVSNLDPKRTLLQLLDPVHLTPDFVRRVRNIRTRGTLAKMNFAVGALPQPAGLARLGDDQRIAALSARVRLAGGTDDIERAFDAAKYGRFSPMPWVELTVPSIIDPTLAPRGRHVVSAYVQYAPYQLRDASWDVARDQLAEAATRAIEHYVPGFTASVVAREILSPADLERDYGLTGGHIFHGDLSLDQLVISRPILGWARYRTPIEGLYLCGSGTHPGTGLDGRSGALAAREIARDLKRRRNARRNGARIPES